MQWGEWRSHQIPQGFTTFLTLDEYLSVVAAVQSSWDGDFEDMAHGESKVTVGNFYEVVCLIKRVNGIKKLSDLEFDPELIPIFSKLGPRGGSLKQQFPLAASEQYLLDPSKVLIRFYMQSLVFIYDPLRQETGVIRSANTHASLLESLKRIPSHTEVKEYGSADRYHIILESARSYDTSISVEEEYPFEKYEKFQRPQSKANNIAVVSFILEPIICPVFEGDSSLIEMAACDLFIRPYLIYNRHTVQKARNLPSKREVVVSILDASQEQDSSTLVVCGELLSRGGDSICIKTGGRYSVELEGFGVGDQGIRILVEGNTRDKSNSKISSASTYKIDIRDKRLKNIFVGDLGKDVDAGDDSISVEGLFDRLDEGIVLLPNLA